MLLQFLELSVDLASITAVVLPIIAVCFFIITIPWLKNGSGSKLRRYLSYAIRPPGASEENSDTHEGSAISPEDKNRLYFYYLGIALFLISFFIGEFYQVLIDLSLPVNQSTTGEYRSATTVVFQSLFNAGWIGSLPWFGVTDYHGTWAWIFFTAGITDNPGFLRGVLEILVIISLVVGCVFLAPLVIKSIRQSFVPSMFFFMTGMTIFTKTAVGYFAGALKLLYSSLEFQYTNIVVTSNMIPNYTWVLTSCVLMIVPMFALFVILGRKLWKVHYTDSRSRAWFTAYISLSFWIGLILMVVVM